MNNSRMPASVFCFGEILWDVLPGGAQPGGALLNVAYHLNKLGVSVDLISRVGADRDGAHLKRLMNQWDLRSDFLQIDPIHETSRVIAKVDDQKDVSYEIIFPVAWDFIESDSSLLAAVETADYFVYGSLASRNEVSGATLLELLNVSSCKVLDINLRPPFYEKNTLEALLSKADILKVNKEELEEIISLFLGKAREERDQVNWLKETFQIQEVVLTKGAKGAGYYPSSGIYQSPGMPVEVIDTVGSGDSFLAAFVAAHSCREDPNMILKKATAMGAFIAGKKGGCPDYEREEYLTFLDT